MHEKTHDYLLWGVAVLVVVILIFSWTTHSIVSNTQSVVSDLNDRFTKLTQGQQPSQPTQGETQQRVNLEVGNAPVKGDEDSKVTVIVFSDPSCPFCGAAAGTAADVVAYMKQRSPNWEPAVPGIIKEYVDTGKARIAFKYFPGHGRGVEAMEMMWCADEQGKFWEMHDVMFANQKLMESGNVPELKTAALTVSGLDKDKFEACVAGEKYKEKYGADTQEGSAVGVQGTPAFFVNGILISGAQPFSALKQVIDAELNA